MPTYDYICKKCGHRFEAFQSISADTLSECPECGGMVERKIGAGAGLMFKGSGFYITDYKNKSNSSSSTKQGKTEPKNDPSIKKRKKAS